MWNSVSYAVEEVLVKGIGFHMTCCSSDLAKNEQKNARSFSAYNRGKIPNTATVSETPFPLGRDLSRDNSYSHASVALAK